MKLKYYLRGLGVGITLTVIIMMISFSGKQNTLSDDEVIERARKLGMVMQDERVMGLTDAKKDKENSANKDQGTSDDATPEDQDETDKSNAEKKTEDSKTSNEDLKIPEADAQTPADTKTPDTTKTPEATKAPTDTKTPVDTKTPDTTKTPPADAKIPDAVPEMVAIEVLGGEYSDKISQKLFAAALIDDPEAFNKYLVDSGADNLIAIGTHNIPKGSTWEDIAKILCQKPDIP